MNNKLINYILLLNSKNKLLGTTIFIIIVSLVSLTFLPVSPFNFISVYLYPSYLSALFVSIMWHILSAIIGFLIISHYKPKILIDMLDKVPDLKLLLTDKKIKKEDYLELGILTRIAPSLPYGLVNYFWGLTNISFSTYMISTIIGFLPFVLVETWIFINTKMALSSKSQNKTHLIFVIIATIIISYIIDKKIKSIIKEKSNSDMK